MKITPPLGEGASAQAGYESVIAISAAAAAVTAANPMTAQDDIIVGGVPSGGVAPPTRLAKGSDGQVLTVDPTVHHLVWATIAGATFATPSIALGTAAAAGTASTVIRSDATILAFDATAPSTQAVGDSATAGAATVAARRDHKHAITNPLSAQDDLWIGGTAGAPDRLAKGSDSQVLTVDPSTHHLVWAASAGASFATPAITLGTAAAAGTAATSIRSDATIVAFDTTAPVTQAFSDTAAAGSATVAARRDHKHGMPASPGAAGALVLIDSKTSGTASASLDFTSDISSTYDVYMMTFQDVMPATNQACPMLRYSTDNGATWISTSSYGWKIQHQAGSTSRTDTGLILFGDSTAKGLYNAGSYPFNCDLYLFNPLGTTYPKQVKWIGNALYYDGSNWYIFHGGGYMAPTTTAINAIQFLMSSGNIASGIVRLYGITK